VDLIESEKGEEFDFLDVVHLVNGKRGREAEQRGDADGGIWSAGQVVELIDSIPTCQQLMTQMMQEAEDIVLSRLNSMVKPHNSLVTVSARSKLCKNKGINIIFLVIFCIGSLWYSP
jgi:nitronate monooxygenase